MRRIPQILLVLVPSLISMVLTRWIIVMGPELRTGIQNFVYQHYRTYMRDWELDHAVFGFTLGAPFHVIALVLLSFTQLNWSRLAMHVLTFYAAQMLFLLVLSYLFVDLIEPDSPFLPFDYLMSFPHVWFWNAALIVASLFAYLTILSFVFVRWYRNRHQESATLDQ